MKNIVMIGTGYVGLVTGACLADIGHNVLCVDKDKGKIQRLEKGEIPIYEPGLEEVVKRNVENGRLTFSSELKLKNTDAVFLGVGTPTDPNTNNADLTAFLAAAAEVKQKLENKCVVVTKSTVPAGTGKKLKNILQGAADVVSNPEFLREGNAVHDFMNPDRIVIGVETEAARKAMAEIYSPMKGEIVFTSIESAELIKYAANAFLATKVAFINEMADLCEKIGADIEDVSKGMGLDKRIGGQFLKAGPGIGGSCFPKDIRSLSAQEKSFGLDSKLVEAVIESNETRKKNMAARIAEIAGSGTIAVLGLTFKANTDDMRESASLTIIPLLQKAGFKIKAYDPQGMHEAAKILKDVEYAKTSTAALEGASAAVILTEWPEFKNIDFNKANLRKNIIIDLRNLLDKTQLSNFAYYSVGRSPQLADQLIKQTATA